MTPRSIALQGLGYSALLVALQGFGPTESLITGPYPAFNPGPPQRVTLASIADEDEELVLLITAALHVLKANQ